MRPMRITVLALLGFAAAACGISAVGAMPTDDASDGGASSTSSSSSSSSSSSGGAVTDDGSTEVDAGDSSPDAGDASTDAIVDAPSDGTVLVPPYLILTHAPAAASNNLTTEGLTEWAHWSFNGVGGSIRKANTTDVISLLTRSGNSLPNSQGLGVNVTWSNGPTGNETGTSDWYAGVVPNGTSGSATVSAPSGPTKQTFIVFVGGANLRGRMTARFSNSAVPAKVDNTYANMNGSFAVRYQVEYATVTTTTVVMDWEPDAVGANPELRFSSAALR